MGGKHRASIARRDHGFQVAFVIFAVIACIALALVLLL